MYPDNFEGVPIRIRQSFSGWEAPLDQRLHGRDDPNYKPVVLISKRFMIPELNGFGDVTWASQHHWLRGFPTRTLEGPLTKPQAKALWDRSARTGENPWFFPFVSIRLSETTWDFEALLKQHKAPVVFLLNDPTHHQCYFAEMTFNTMQKFGSTMYWSDTSFSWRLMETPADLIEPTGEVLLISNREKALAAPQFSVITK